MIARPWIEGAVLLAAHGHDTAPLSSSPRRRGHLHPIASILMTLNVVPFAFAPTLTGPAKPRAFASVHHLARHIEASRNGQALELVDVEDIEIPGEPGVHRAVQIFTLLMDNGRDRCLGYAWLGGHGRERLEHPLRDARREALTERRAA